MRAELIGHFEPCMTEIYLHIYARMADYIRTHPYGRDSRDTRRTFVIGSACTEHTRYQV